MKKISVVENVIVESRTYKPGEYSEADMPVQHFDELLRTGFGVLIEDGKSEPVKLSEPVSIVEFAPQDLFPPEVLNEDVEQVSATMPEDGEAAPALLDGTVKEIKESLPSLPEERLYAMLKEECAGKNRKGVVEAIEDELDARVQAAPGDNNE